MNTRSLARRALSLLVAVAFIAPSFPLMSPAVALAEPVVLGNVRVTTAGRAFTTPSGSFISTASVVNTSAVAAWVKRVGKVVDRKMANASIKLNKKRKRLDFKAAVTGYKLNQSVAKQQIIDELRSKVPTGTLATVALKTAVTKPKHTKVGKTILVVRSRRKIYLYNNKKVEKTYRCAVGMAAYPTPTGTFYIGKKVKNPSWTNGGASWASGMPSYIGPGPSNPLGTRALYVYKKHGGDTGIRFHGTTNDSSIGHAASHGCMRMHRKDVENFFPRVKVGTTVYIIK